MTDDDRKEPTAKERADDAAEYERVKHRALELMKTGFNLGGKPLKREEIYNRQICRYRNSTTS